MTKYISACFLLCALLLGSCKSSQHAVKGSQGGSNTMADRLNAFKRMQFDKSFFDGINEKMTGNYQNALDNFEAAIKLDGQNAACWYEIANASVQLGKISDAEKAAENAVKYDGGENKWYLLQLSDIYRFEKKWSQAAVLYEKLIALEPDEPEDYARLAAIYLAENKVNDALKVFDRMENNFGVSEEVAFQKHGLYVQQGKYEKAEEEINKLLKDNPGDTRYMQLLAETYMKAGNKAKAIEIYDELAKKNPDDGETQLALADYYYKQGDKAKSFDLLQKAFANKELGIDNKIGILYNNYLMQQSLSDQDKKDAYVLTELMVKAHPADPKGHAIYGDFLYQDKRYDEARNEYRKSLETKKTIFAVWQQLLLADAELKDFKALADESEKALDYFPNQPLVYFMDGLANIQLKNYKKAASTLESGLNQTIDNPNLEIDFYNNLAEAYYRLNDYTKSDSYFEKVLKLDSNNISALNNYAYYLSVRNVNLDKAEAMSKKTLDKEPQNASYLDTYGWILYKRGKYEEAAKYIKQSLDREKESAEVNEHYGDVQYKLGNVEMAMQYWKYARQYGSDSQTLGKKIENHKIVE